MNPRTPPYHVLFLCTGNSARSILAEAILRAAGAGRFVTHSAGSHPTGRVNPHALETLREHGLPVEGLHSKNWDEFAGPGAPPIDFIFTVCDNAAGEVCPIWPGHPLTVHWGIPDPAAAEGDADTRRAAFAMAYRTLDERLRAFAALPDDELAATDNPALARRLRALADSHPA